MEIIRNHLFRAKDRCNSYSKILLRYFPRTKKANGGRTMYLIEIASNTAFLQFYKPAQPRTALPFSSCPCKLLGRAALAVVAMLAMVATEE
jgi:hypothetical protein